MSVCKKCCTYNVVFGLLILVASLWSGAPSWFTPWTLVGLYLLLWGALGLGGGEH